MAYKKKHNRLPANDNAPIGRLYSPEDAADLLGIELRIWVAKEDKEAALDAVQEFVKEGLWQSVCHQMYGADWRMHPEKFRNIASATGHPKIRDVSGR